MTERKDTGGPAFPLRNVPYEYYGMTLRDWFAGQVLSGRLAGGNTSKDAATHAYDIADAMLIERKRDKE